MDLKEQLATKEVVVFLGPGGVGKTTVSAAASLAAAEERKTLVFTIDPARRLADAMGLKIGAEPVEVESNLHAMMLDTKKALDDLVEKYAENPETLKRIFASPFYQTLSDAFAGSEEFVAMGTLYELVHSGRWDVIIVDTPPSRHAVDFLETNRRLIRVFESGVVKYLFKPTRMLRLGGGAIAGALAKWTSRQYLEDMSEFITTFDKMFLEMEKRVRSMERLMSDRDRTSINLVTVPEKRAAETAISLHREITLDLGLAVEACVVNRVYPKLVGIENLEEVGDDETYREGALKVLQETLDVRPDYGTAFLDDVVAAARHYDAVSREQQRHLAVIEDELGVPLVLVPALASSIHDVEGLKGVKDRLLEPLA